MNNLHPVMQQALAPFVPFAPRPAPNAVLKAACGNRNVTPMVIAQVMRYGANDYRVELISETLPGPIEFSRAEQFGRAFSSAHLFSRLHADNVQEILQAHQ